MWFRHYGLWVVVPLAASAALGIMYDLRFVIVTMMMVFIMLPMLFGYLYFYYMLAPEARRAVLPMQVRLHGDGSLSITYLPTDAECDKPPYPPETVPAGEIQRIVKWRGYRAVVIRGSRLSFILIPENAIVPA